MASARRTGTNEQITTYGTGETYTALGTWESATDTDHVTDTETDVLEVVDTDTSFDDSVTMNTATNNATYFRIVRPEAGSGHNGTTSTGAFFSHTSATGSIFLMQDTNEQIQDLILQQSRNDAGNDYIIRTQADACIIVGCLAFDSTNAGTGETYGFYADSGNNSVFVLCLADNQEFMGFSSGAGAGTTTYLYNCTIVDCGLRGVWQSDGTTVCKNVLVDNSVDNFFAGTYTGSDYCASSDSDSPDSGANNRINQTFTFVSASTDFHLASGDAGAKGHGQDLSADGVFAFDDDIDGDTMSDWPIGFDEPQTATSRLALLGVG